MLKKLLPLMLCCALDSSAEELIQVGSPTGYIELAQVVESSSLVARVTVVSATVVPHEDATDGNPCGIVYRTKVVQALKGSQDGDVQFFLPVATSPLQAGLKYLVFLEHRSERQARDLFASLNVALPYAESKRLKCKFPAGYYVSLHAAPLAFDADAGIQFGGEWLSLGRGGVPSGLVLCEVPVTNSANVESRHHRQKKSGGAVVSWIEMARLIKRADSVLSFLNRGLDACGQ
ncbi:hypothetical protein [Janthinobacterium sp. P210006]|uniref:hypothetical protein n=1 Tax=Janthinobacterium sp. P210006 TaxID=3112939 RepID=UPI002E2611FC|nr:hypothetical protein [Janthinobacterium sp. P210006]